MSGLSRRIDRRIVSTTELLGVTRSMRALAAVNLRRYEVVADAVVDYEAIIEDGLQVILREGRIDLLDEFVTGPNDRTGLIVFGSNQGLCGPINRRVASRAGDEARSVSSLVRVGAVGARLAAELELGGLAPTSQWDLPVTPEAATSRADDVLAQINRWKQDDDIVRTLLVFPRFLGRHRAPEPVMLQLTPPDREWLEWLAIRRWPSRIIPTFSMPWEELAADLIDQALFARLHRSFAQTMASVATSRLRAMDTAQRNIEERVTALRKQQRHVRHSEITEELLDVVSSFEITGR